VYDVVTSARSYYDRSCLFVRQFVKLVEISRQVKSPILMNFGTDVQHAPNVGSLLTFKRSGSTFKVMRFQNDPPATAIPNVYTPALS